MILKSNHKCILCRSLISVFIDLLIIHVHTKHCNKRFVQWPGTLNKHLKGSLNAAVIFK